MNPISKYIKLIYYLFTPRNNYIRIGLLLLITFSLLSIYLNIQGFNCLSKLSQYYNEDNNQHTVNNTSIQELEFQCFIITNSYVYSIFGIIIGIILIVFYYFKKRKNT